MIRVPFFLLFGLNKGALNQKGQKGTTQEPRYSWTTSPSSGIGLGFEGCVITGLADPEAYDLGMWAQRV